MLVAGPPMPTDALSRRQRITRGPLDVAHGGSVLQQPVRQALTCLVAAHQRVASCGMSGELAFKRDGQRFVVSYCVGGDDGLRGMRPHVAV